MLLPCSSSSAENDIFATKSIFLPKVVKSLRKFFDLGQKEFAELFGVTQGAISKLEHGSLEISVSFWFEICKKFSIDPVLSYTRGIILFEKTQESTFFKNNLTLKNSIELREIYPLVMGLVDFLGPIFSRDFASFCGTGNGSGQEGILYLNSRIDLEALSLLFTKIQEIINGPEREEFKKFVLKNMEGFKKETFPSYLKFHWRFHWPLSFIFQSSEDFLWTATLHQNSSKRKTDQNKIFISFKGQKSLKKNPMEVFCFYHKILLEQTFKTPFYKVEEIGCCFKNSTDKCLYSINKI